MCSCVHAIFLRGGSFNDFNKYTGKKDYFFSVCLLINILNQFSETELKSYK